MPRSPADYIFRLSWEIKVKYITIFKELISKMQVDTLSTQSKRSWLSDIFRWCPTSADLLEQAEEKIFSYVKKPFELSFVSIPSKETPEVVESIRSVAINTEATGKSVPLVLLHGFASGIGLWVLNFESLSCDRPLYALDIVGFGRSSRPAFSNDASEIETQFVESVEEWRKQVGLEKFILLGHSMGGFLATSYAIKYPDRIKHLILADPWGFPEPEVSTRKTEIPTWVKYIKYIVQPFNPLAVLRAAGPWGPQLVEKVRPDILRNFEHVVKDTSDVSNYIYHCNAQNPSGESAFKAMSAHFGYAKMPMINRISQLNEEIPVTFIYGSRSWVDSKSGFKIKALRQNSSVEIKVIQGSGHHVYAEKDEEFNNFVSNVCKKADLKTMSSLSDCLQKELTEELEQSSTDAHFDKQQDDSETVSATL